MQNNTSKTGYQNNRVPHSGRRQQIQNGTRYGDESNGEKRALLVQRNDFISSKTGLKSKSFVPAKRIEICASTSSGKDGGQRIPPLLSLNSTDPNARSCKQNDHNSRNADVTNNSSNKRSYFEPYDPRRSPGVRNNGNIGAQPRPAMCQYVQPYQQFNYYQQFPGPHNGFQYQHVQAPNAATAVAPNGETIYIPLDDRQYEIKKDNHDLYDMPDGCELLLLESAGEFESSVQLISSPRPVDLKGGLSQDSRSDSGESSDEISYGEPDTDSDSESESEFVENCVSDVLKTIAESVQNITVEESKNIVQKALQDFEDSQETATEKIVPKPISNDSKTTLPNTCKSENKSDTSKTDTTESDIVNRHSSNVIKPRALDNCFWLTESHDLTKPQSLQRKKQRFVERTTMNDLFEKSEPCSTNDDCNSGPIIDKTVIISESTSTNVISSNSDVHTHSNMTRTANTVKPWSNDVHPYNNATRKAKPRRKQTEITNATSKNDTSGLVATCNKPKLDNKQNQCETMFRPSAPGGLCEKPSGQAINSKSNSKRGTNVKSTSQHNSVQDSLSANNDRNSKVDIPRKLETYDCPLTNAPTDITNKSKQALGYDRDNTHDNCRHIASPNQWVIQGQQEPIDSQYPLYGNYSPIGASNEWNSLIQPGAQNVTGGSEVIQNISVFGSIYGVPVHNEWFLPDGQSFFSPSFINTNGNLPSPGTASNHQEIVNHICSSNGVQDEWAVPQNIGSVEQVLSPTPYQNVWTSPHMLNGFRSSPVSYGPAGMEHAMYEAGQVMIDGQGFFEPSHHLNDQHQTVYLPDNITFEAHQPASSPTATPVYTLSIQEPSSPDMVCQSGHQSVHGELTSSSNTTSYQSKTQGLSADSQVFEPGKQHYGRHESESSDYSQTIDLAYQQYGDSQPIKPVDQNCVNTTGETIFDTWGTQVGTVQQNGQQDGVMLGTNHIGDESLGECRDGQFYVCYDEENIYTDPKSGLSYPAIHMTDDYLLTVLFKDGVCLEIAVDKSMRLVHHENKLVAAMSGSGEQTCIIHPAARIYQTTSCVHATVYNNRRVKLTDEYVTFGSEKESFRFDQRQITSVNTNQPYMDLSDDESVKLLQTDDGTPADNDKLRDKCMEILAHAHFWKHGKNGSTVIINGTKIVQSDKGDVTVNCGPIKFIRMNPTKSVIRLKTQLIEADIETNWTVRLSRGHLALNVIQAGLMVSNGKIKGYLDRDDKLQAFSLPDHRVLMLGQPVPQHRPGVPTRSRRNDHNKKTEPEGDHSGYSRPIVDNDTERGRQLDAENNRQWETF